MMKRLLALTLAFILMFALSGPVYSADTAVDQANDDTADINRIYSIKFNEPIGQEFVPAEPLLSGVEIWITTDSVSPKPAEITITIHELLISGTVIATQTAIGVAEDYEGWLYFEFTAPVSVTPGATYVLSMSATEETKLVNFTTDKYPAGYAIIADATNVNLDLLFRTYAPSENNNTIPPMAAPNIASIILKAEGVNPNQSTGKGKNKVKLNLIAETAHFMGPQTLFDGIEMAVTKDGTEVCNPLYWEAVLTYLNNTFHFTFDYTLDDYIIDQS